MRAAVCTADTSKLLRVCHYDLWLELALPNNTKTIVKIIAGLFNPVRMCNLSHLARKLSNTMHWAFRCR